MSLDQALLIAHQRGYTLIQLSETDPPVCRLVDLGKYKYELEKKKRKAKGKSLEIKEIRLRLNIEPHDLEIKKKQLDKFLEKGHKVKLTLLLKGREFIHIQRAYDFLKKITEELGERVAVEKKPEKIGRQIYTILVKKK